MLTNNESHCSTRSTRTPFHSPRNDDINEQKPALRAIDLWPASSHYLLLAVVVVERYHSNCNVVLSRYNLVGHLALNNTHSLLATLQTWRLHPKSVHQHRSLSCRRRRRKVWYYNQTRFSCRCRRRTLNRIQKPTTTALTITRDNNDDCHLY